MRFTRFTPTGVGTIMECIRRPRRPSVHPHGRGDNAVRLEHTYDRTGSPPRAWGQSRSGGAGPQCVRFTPTGVGTMCSSASIQPFQTVHPHGRGDNREPEPEQALKNGSPPRAWGQCYGV